MFDDRPQAVGIDPLGRSAQELKRTAMTLQKRLRAFPRKRLHEDRPRIWQRHHEQRYRCLLAIELDLRLAVVHLSFSRWMRQRQKHLLPRLTPVPNRQRHHRQPAGITVLIPRTLKDPPYRMTRLLRSLPIRFQNLLDDRQIRSQLSLLPRLPQSIIRRFRVSQNLLQRVSAQPILPTGRSLAQFVRQNFPTNFLQKFQIATHSCVS